MAEKKWHQKWWGLLWTLALVDSSPGRSVHAFMEMDEALKNLPDNSDQIPSRYHHNRKENKTALDFPHSRQTE